MIDVRQIEPAELDRLVDVHNVVRPDDPTTAAELVDWRDQAEDMVWLVAADGDRDVGGGLGLVGWHSRPGTARVEAWTRPEARGKGVGQALYAELLRWAAERGCVEVQTSVSDADEASLAWADRRGFREIGRELRVSLDLRAVDAPAIDPPDGIEIVPWAERPELADGMYGVFVEADPDIPGSEDVMVPGFDEWLRADMQGTSDRPEAVFVALAGDEVVGYAKLSIPEAQTGAAWHDLTGVKRAWRGRGIASALKRAQIRWAKEAGYTRLTTMNEERNAPIRHLNERYGYRPEPGRVVLSTAISSPD
jgi:GNAT superfamily N-acetyltransferase